MGKLKKMKKLSLRTRDDANKAQDAAHRAEEAHRRVAALLGDEAAVARGVDRSDPDRPKFHTAPAAES